MTIEPGTRLSVVTGDNGLGKTFLLDAAWFALTRRWVGHGALPAPGADDAQIAYTVEATAGPTQSTVTFDRGSEDWVHGRGRPPITGFVVYARVDGGFAVWDPNRNAQSEGDSSRRQPSSYSFSASQVLDGLVDPATGAQVCNGLVEDWVSWQDRGATEFAALEQALAALSPGEGVETLSVGDPMRVSIGDARRFPTLRMPYGDVPITHASAGARRIVTLAYLLVWAWSEHHAASELLRVPPSPRVTLIVDELEAHLHPKWQRVVLPALIDAAAAVGMQGQVQIVAATHAPLVLASLEPKWDDATDRLFALDLVTGDEGAHAVCRRLDFTRRGDVNSWLT